MFNVVRQEWEESEEGRGLRPDGYSLHLGITQLRQYLREYWTAQLVASVVVPNVYSRPCGDPSIIEVGQLEYEALVAAGGSLRLP